MKHITTISLAVLGLAFWLHSGSAKNDVQISRGIASEINDDLDEEGVYENLEVRRDKTKPQIKNKSKEDKRQNVPKKDKKEDLLDDSEFSKINPGDLWKQCQTGDRNACRSLGVACQQKDYDACYFVGNFLAEADAAKAIPYYKAACEQMSHANSCFELATILSESHDETSKELATGYMSTSCFEGNISACLKLAENDSDPDQREFYLAEAYKIQIIKDSQTIVR